MAGAPLPPRPAPDGGTDVLAAARCAQLCEMYDVHGANRVAIDALIRDLDQHGRDIADAERQSGWRARERCHEQAAERAAGAMGPRCEQLEAQLAQLEADSERRDAELEQLRGDLRDLEPRVRASEPDPRDAALQDLVQKVEEQERRLQEMESAAVAGGEQLREKSRTLDALAGERAAIAAQHSVETGHATADLSAVLAEREQAERAARAAAADRARAEGALRQLRDATHRAAEHKAVLEEVQAALRGDLQSSADAAAEAGQTLRRQHTEEDLQRAQDPGGGGALAGAVTIEEVMYLIKAHGIDLHLDYAFIGEIRDRALRLAADGSRQDAAVVAGDCVDASERGLRAFSDAWRYVRAFVCQQQGPQEPGQRWRAADGEAWLPVPLDAVEPLLSCLKQLVVAWDMMPREARERVTFAGELVRNAALLVDLLQEASVKFGEIEAARAAEARREEERAREEEQLREEERWRRRRPSARRPPRTPQRRDGTDRRD